MFVSSLAEPHAETVLSFKPRAAKRLASRVKGASDRTHTVPSGSRRSSNGAQSSTFVAHMNRTRKELFACGI